MRQSTVPGRRRQAGRSRVVGSLSSLATNRARSLDPTHPLAATRNRSGPACQTDPDLSRLGATAPPRKGGLDLARAPSAPALRPSRVAHFWATTGRRSPATSGAGRRLATRTDPAGHASCRDRFPRQPPPQKKPHRRRVPPPARRAVALGVTPEGPTGIGGRRASQRDGRGHTP